MAFRFITPSLLKENVFSNRAEIADSIRTLTKTSSVVNQQHPLVSACHSFCESLEKLAHLREAQEEIRANLDAITTFILQAGLVKEARVVGRGWRGAKSGAREAGQALTEALGGGRGAELAGQAVEYFPHAAALGGGLLAGEALHENLAYGQGLVPRTVRGGVEHVTAALMPTSEAGLRRRYMVQSGQ